ncbi:metallophosphoesterase [Galbibacter sp.]|uniref:metallophosphoesterase n=1 Tax=Galbibacter sp. TaxID=2918471 RepID=UPI003A90A9AB
MKRTRHVVFIGALILVLGCNPQQTSFEFVVLPDTQSYMESYPDIYLSQMQWIADNKNRFSFVIHEGDITQNNTEKEWRLAKEGFDMLEAKVPYTFSLGNHDMGSAQGLFADVRNTKKANSYFDLKILKANNNVFASFPEGTVDNLCSKFKIGGYTWLVFSLEFGPRNKTIDWANKLISAHPNAKVIINTHAYLYNDNTLHGGDHWWQPQDYGIGEDSGEESVNNGVQLWNKLVKKHPGILMVFSGHILKSGVGTLISKGDHGNTVYQMLANYQKGVEGSKNGGNGFLRIVKVDLSGQTITVSTYSPWLDAYKEDTAQDFSFENINF